MTRLNSMNSNTQLHLPPELQQAMASGQMAQMAMQNIFLQTTIETMSKLVSVSYMDSITNGRQQKAFEIRKRIKEENPYIEDDKLNEMIMEEIAKDSSIQLKIDLGLLADISVQAGQTMLAKLQTGK